MGTQTCPFHIMISKKRKNHCLWEFQTEYVICRDSDRKKAINGSTCKTLKDLRCISKATSCCMTQMF